MKTHDAARFDDHDPPQLVWASLACRFCLHRPHLVTIVGGAQERVAVAMCGLCHETTRVRLSEGQACRLWALPRGRTFVHFPPTLW